MAREGTPYLFAKYLPCALRLMGNRTDAEDLLVETYLALRQYVSEESPDFYPRFYGLLWTLGNQSFARRKSWQSLRGCELREKDSVCPGIEAEALDRVEALRLLRRLPALQQKALVMFALGYSQGQIARACGARPETINTRIQEARKKLARWQARDTAATGTF